MKTTTRLVTAIAVTAALSLCAAAEIRFEPPAPSAGEPFRIIVEGVWRDGCVPATPRLEVHDRRLLVTFKLAGSEGCTAALTPYSSTLEGVRLSANHYTLITRVRDVTLETLFEEKVFQVAGDAAPIGLYPHFDTEDGNRVVALSGSFPCDTSSCAAPEVLFGANPSPDVRRVEGSQLHAVVPPGQGLVDLTVRGATYSRTKIAGFQYVRRDEWEALMLPVYIKDVIYGAYDSKWITDWSVLNQNGASLISGLDFLYIDESCPVTCIGFTPLYEGVMNSYLRLVAGPSDKQPPTALIHLRKDAAASVATALRTRDFSRQSESWGCEIPVVREDELRRVVTLVDVPREERFRQRLRIYNPRVSDLGAIVEFFDAEGGRLASREVALAWPEGALGGIVQPGYFAFGSRGLPLQPAWAEIDLASIPELEDHRRAWIRVTAKGNGKIWAFVSITNDATQQVSTVTPQ
ncbi:MAG: hypothetical protein NDJ92_08980 [Thermoanaerobaculia bacterium]|nr:hypothetical protein [Thermoanaerobaculia bacterium]